MKGGVVTAENVAGLLRAADALGVEIAFEDCEKFVLESDQLTAGAKYRLANGLQHLPLSDVSYFSFLLLRSVILTLKTSVLETWSVNFQKLVESQLLRTLDDVSSVCADEALQKELFKPVGRLLFRTVCEALRVGKLQVRYFYLFVL